MNKDYIYFEGKLFKLVSSKPNGGNCIHCYFKNTRCIPTEIIHCTFTRFLQLASPMEGLLWELKNG
jgi:hypothetical protein